jgi:hypothetical protein
MVDYLFLKTIEADEAERAKGWVVFGDTNAVTRLQHNVEFNEDTVFSDYFAQFVGGGAFQSRGNLKTGEIQTTCIDRGGVRHVIPLPQVADILYNKKSGWEPCDWNAFVANNNRKPEDGTFHVPPAIFHSNPEGILLPFLKIRYKDAEARDGKPPTVHVSPLQIEFMADPNMNADDLATRLAAAADDDDTGAPVDLATSSAPDASILVVAPDPVAPAPVAKKKKKKAAAVAAPTSDSDPAPTSGPAPMDTDNVIPDAAAATADAVAPATVPKPKKKKAPAAAPAAPVEEAVVTPVVDPPAVVTAPKKKKKKVAVDADAAVVDAAAAAAAPVVPVAPAAPAAVVDAPAAPKKKKKKEAAPAPTLDVVMTDAPAAAPTDAPLKKPKKKAAAAAAAPVVVEEDIEMKEAVPAPAPTAKGKGKRKQPESASTSTSSGVLVSAGNARKALSDVLSNVSFSKSQEMRMDCNMQSGIDEMLRNKNAAEVAATLLGNDVMVLVAAIFSEGTVDKLLRLEGGQESWTDIVGEDGAMCVFHTLAQAKRDELEKRSEGDASAQLAAALTHLVAPSAAMALDTQLAHMNAILAVHAPEHKEIEARLAPQFADIAAGHTTIADLIHRLAGGNLEWLVLLALMLSSKVRKWVGALAAPPQEGAGSLAVAVEQGIATREESAEAVMLWALLNARKGDTDEQEAPIDAVLRVLDGNQASSSNDGERNAKRHIA